MSADEGTASAASRAGERGLLGTVVRTAVGTAWWATGPIRWGGQVAIEAAEAALSEVRNRSRWLHAHTQSRPGQVSTTLDLMIRSLLRPVIAKVVDAALEELDLTTLIVQNVDLDAVAAQLDVEKVIKRVDLDAVVATVDLDAAVENVDLKRIVDRIDIDEIVAGVDLEAVVDRIDVDSIVKRVDLDAVVALVDLKPIIGRLDLNEIADGLDLDPLVAKVDLAAVVDRLDFAAIIAKVDPDPVVAKVDFDAAIGKIDLIGLAERVVEGIDLAGIIRDSTGSLASEAVHGVRVQGQHADDAVGQLVGRVLRRRSTLDGATPHGGTQHGVTPNGATPR